jgi:hypothetical protein
LDESTGRDCLSGFDSQVVKGNNYNRTDWNRSEPPKTDAPYIEVFDFFYVILVLLLSLCNFVPNPLVEPGHFVFDKMVEEVFEQFKFSFLELNVVKKHALHLLGHWEDLFHDYECNNEPKNQWVGQFHVQVDANSKNVQRFKDETK